MKITLPFGRSCLPFEVNDERLRGVILSGCDALNPVISEHAIIRMAMSAPIGSPPLRELIKGKRRVAIITSDHTRPMPSHIVMPLLLEEVRAGSPNADVLIVVATGCHRAMTDAEMRGRFGDSMFGHEKFMVHNCDSNNRLVSVGKLPSGGDCLLNESILDAEILIAEGFIEPHFFAGFSGGRKAVLPGCAGRATVLANHCAKLIADPLARAGILDGNPIHADMIHAGRAARLAFIVNVILDAKKKVVAAFAGDMDAAHRAGCELMLRHGLVRAMPADIVVTTNGGYPLDQNIYQTVKSMTTAEASCRPGGVIIVASECADGHGGDEFSRAFEEFATPDEMMVELLKRPWNFTKPDQWQTQILCRILMNFTVIMVTGPGAPGKMVEKLRMNWAPSLREAMRMADSILGRSDADVTVIPDGVGVIVRA